MIAVIDYGMGNLRSVQKALERNGSVASITQSAADLNDADKIVLPGVGAMAPAMDKLHSLNLTDAIRENIGKGKAFLGICLGLQLLFESSTEDGETQGLGILKGTINPFQQLKVPHMGWNQLQIQKDNCPLLKNIGNLANVYFCHSYFAPDNSDQTAASTEYGVSFGSMLWKDNVYACQFHPEKSQSVGMQILKNFVELT